MKTTSTIKTMAMVGVMAALVFAASQISINIPTPVDNTRLHLGNVMCLLSGLLLGPVSGGLAAGFGSLFFDLTNPLYIASAPFTFLFKFAMAFVCGKLARTGGADARNQRKNFVAAACGAFTYIVLYLSKTFFENYFFLRMELSPVFLTVAQKALVSSVNGVMAVVIAVPLAAALRVALERAHVFNKPAGQK